MLTPRFRRGFSRTALAAAALLTGLGLSTGAAQGWFAAVVSGSSPAPVGELRALTATAQPVSAPLLPGGAADVTVELANPNDIPVRVDSIALDPSRGSGGIDVDRPGCDATALTLAPQTAGAPGWWVPARVEGVDGRLGIRLPDALAMRIDAPDACQGATFTIHLRAS